jgi:hypothetical protein
VGREWSGPGRPWKKVGWLGVYSNGDERPREP